MTPWERERLQEFVIARVALNRAQMAEREAIRRLERINLNTPRVVEASGLTYVVDRDEEDIRVREAKS